MDQAEQPDDGPCANKRPSAPESGAGSPRRRPDRARLFFALWPRPALARRLHELARAAQAVSGGRVMRRDTLHQTLAFIGDIPRERISQLIAVGRTQRFTTFGFELDLLRRWGRNRIVWAGSSTPPPALCALAVTLVRQLSDAGFVLEERDFVPHVTLVRNSEREPAFDTIEPLVWMVEDFVLVESIRTGKGANYRIVERFAAVNGPAGP
ncbi:MAG TPA: RNA 2',3'-cyclic phosphodiesterase [Azoarcus taiwanensis]|nr:RNA 2',3'-cyclic phosphodiesterase [Azoarcus taiwanensis]